MMNKEKNSMVTFCWRVLSAHTVAYFVAGIFALLFLDYQEHFSSESLSLLMRPVDSPWVAAGSGLQDFRGLIIALVLYPFRKVFLGSKRGGFKLWLLVMGLSFFSTIRPAPGSFEGYIYTILPVQYHLLGIPEALLYTTLFAFFVCGWYKKPFRI